MDHPGCRLGALACSLAVVVGLAACSAPAPAPSHAVAQTTITITTGVKNGNFYPVGVALAKEYAAALPDVHTEVKTTAGALNNLELLQLGEADLALSFADVAYAAYSGHLGDYEQEFRRVRAIALLPLAPVQVVASRHITVRSVDELRGRHVHAGGAGSGSFVTADLLLRAYGIDPSTVVQEHTAREDAPASLAAGTLDAAIVLARYPVEMVRNSTAKGAYLVPITGAAAERLHREYPFFRPMLIPAGVYPGQVAAIQTIGVNSVLLCRAELDEALVYRLTKALFETMGEKADDLLLGPIDLERVAATPIPLHEGAARYYRQRELFP